MFLCKLVCEWIWMINCRGQTGLSTRRNAPVWREYSPVFPQTAPACCSGSSSGVMYVFLAHLSESSGELFWWSAVCLSIYLYAFAFSTSEPHGQFWPGLAQIILGGRGFNCFSNEGQNSPRKENSKKVKIHWTCLKIFSRTRKPISIKLGRVGHSKSFS
jgi:hypothetical protein